MENEQILRESIIAIASEMFRFQHVFEKAISKLGTLEQKKYLRVYFVKEGFTPSQNTHDCGSFVAK